MKLPFGCFIASATSILVTLGVVCIGLIICDQAGKDHSRGGLHTQSFDRPIANHHASAESHPVSGPLSIAPEVHNDRLPFSLPSKSGSDKVFVSDSRDDEDTASTLELPKRKPTRAEVSRRHNSYITVHDSANQFRSMPVQDNGSNVHLVRSVQPTKYPNKQRHEDLPDLADGEAEALEINGPDQPVDSRVVHTVKKPVVADSSTTARPTAETPRDRLSSVERNSQPVRAGGQELQIQEPVEPQAQEVVTKPVRVPAMSTELSNTEIVGWPLPASLMQDLQDLTQVPVTADWATTAIDTFKHLNQLELSDPESVQLLSHLTMLGEQLRQYSESMARDYPQHLDAAIELRRIAYRMERRLEIWSQVYRIKSLAVSDPRATSSTTIARTVANRKSSIEFQKVPESWANYLMLEDCLAAFEDDLANPLRKLTVARQILSRLESPALTAEQRQYAAQVIGVDLKGLLRQAAVSDLQLGKFLEDLETFEEASGPLSDFQLNQHYQNFYWNSDAHVQALSDSVNSHYRNANFRIEVSDELINRLLPSAAEFQQPVRDRILGARVFGQSRISNRLQVKLIPDPQRLSFRLQSLGSVFSRTRAHHSGIVFYNDGNAVVNASKGISIGDDGVSIQPTNVDASSNQRLLDVRTRVDGVPLIGWAARRIAEQQQSQKEPQAREEVENRLKTEFQSRVDQEIAQTIGNAQAWLDRNVFNPLHALELEPTPLEMQTTDENVIVRYRVASRDQMAASTARPQSQPGNLLSVQIHQTAINNILNRMHINGEQFTINEFLDHLNQLAGNNIIPISEDDQRDVTFQFASRDGVRVEFEDEKMLVTLRLKKFRIGKGKTWKNLIISAAYYLQGQGTQMRMVLDEERGVVLQGRQLRFRDQLAVRTAFNALFQTRIEFGVLPTALSSQMPTDDLALSQLIISDGWLGLSINQFPVGAETVEPKTPQRTGRLFRRWR